jgi:hypothetical protein
MTFEQVKLQGCWLGAEISAFVEGQLIPIRLAVHDGSGSPWVVSLWFLHEGDRFWCATNGDAKLASYLQTNPQCGFEVAGDKPPYRGIRGKGQAMLVPERGGEILKLLLKRYDISTSSRLAKSLLAKIDQEVAICVSPSRISSWDFTERMAGAVTNREIAPTGEDRS